MITGNDEGLIDRPLLTTARQLARRTRQLINGYIRYLRRSKREDES